MTTSLLRSLATLAASLALGVAAAAQTPPAKPAAANAAAVKPAAAAVPAACRLEIAGNDLMQFDRKELRVSSTCREVEVVLKHTGKLPVAAMGHNWVLTRTPDAKGVDSAGISAGIRNNHVPPNDKRVVAATALVGGGQSTSVRFPISAVAKGGDYTFFCSFPGHFGIMKGEFVVE
jgi:azurin